MSGLSALPIYVLTGFLGSGKTTLLNRVLRDPAFAATAVLVNEFGEVAIDHLLVQQISENVVLLNSGCLCCAVRGDLVDALRELFVQSLRGEIPPIQRVVIETTGLADPAPIIHTLLTDENLRERYRLAGVITTVDAGHGMEQVTAHEECLRQVVLADVLVLTKQDLCAAPPDALRGRLQALNPGAAIIGPEELAGRLPVLAATTPALPPEAWLDAEGRHDERVRSFTLYRVRPLVWDRFLAWLTPLLQLHGPQILRIKGILNVEGLEQPVVVQGVQHIFYPAAFLPAWPDADHRTKIVFITLDLDEDAVRPGFQALLTADREAV